MRQRAWSCDWLPLTRSGGLLALALTFRRFWLFIPTQIKTQNWESQPTWWLCDALRQQSCAQSNELCTTKLSTKASLEYTKRHKYLFCLLLVGSFVWTHLTNSQESTGSTRQVMRELLANEFLQNKFNTDARQFSRNFEGSHYFETLKLGTNLDANVIFSPR